MTNQPNDPTPRVDGSHFANALAFITEALADDDVESTHELALLDTDSLMEFGEMYNFTEEAFRTALAKFRQACFTEGRRA